MIKTQSINYQTLHIVSPVNCCLYHPRQPKLWSYMTCRIKLALFLTTMSHSFINCCESNCIRITKSLCNMEHVKTDLDPELFCQHGIHYHNISILMSARRMSRPATAAQLLINASGKCWKNHKIHPQHWPHFTER